MALPIQVSARQHDCEYRPDVESRPTVDFNNSEGSPSTLRAPKIKSVSARSLLGASDGRPASNLEHVFPQETETSTLGRLARVISESGVEIAWERIDDIAASYNASHCGRERVFKIHDFYRPQDSTTLADLMMVVADTEVRLGLLCASYIGRALLQQLFSSRDSRGERISTLPAEHIEETATESQEALNSPYLVHVSSDCLYICWKTVGWWEVYDLDSLDILLKEALTAVPCTVMRPQPPPAWIKKYRPTIRRPASSWNCNPASPTLSNAILDNRPCDESTILSTTARLHQTGMLTRGANHEIPLASPMVTERACEQVEMTDNDGLLAFMCNPTETLPPVTSCSFRARDSKGRRLWRKLICM